MYNKNNILYRIFACLLWTCLSIKNRLETIFCPKEGHISINQLNDHDVSKMEAILHIHGVSYSWSRILHLIRLLFPIHLCSIHLIFIIYDGVHVQQKDSIRVVEPYTVWVPWLHFILQGLAYEFEITSTPITVTSTEPAVAVDIARESRIEHRTRRQRMDTRVCAPTTTTICTILIKFEKQQRDFVFMEKLMIFLFKKLRTLNTNNEEEKEEVDQVSATEKRRQAKLLHWMNFYTYQLLFVLFIFAAFKLW